MTKSPKASDVQIKVKGFKIFADRFGKLRCYHRATGTPIDLNKYPMGSLEFLGECSRLSALQNGSGGVKPGTWGLLVKEFRMSQQWKVLRPKTQAFYEEAFLYLKPISDTPLMRFTPPLIVKIRDRAMEKKSWYFANQVKTSMSVAFSWGAERGYISANPAKQVKKIKRPKDLPRANRPWQDWERPAIMQTAPHIRPVLAAMLFTGIDPCDAIALPKSKYVDGVFDLSRQKTGNPVWKPAPKELKAIIAVMPKHDAITLFANSKGKPWTMDGFNTMWFRERERLEKEEKIAPGLTLKGLRHTHATMLREQGESDRTIADALGDKSEAMGRWYSRDADTKDSMTKVVKTFDRHHQIVKPKKKSVKP